MGHDHHFLQRLDRVSAEQCDLALDLYRDDELVRLILHAMTISTACERVAIGLGPGDHPPHIIVARDGHFVTCLGEGMAPYDVPVITHAQFEGIKDDVADIRARLDVAREWRAQGGGRPLLANMFSSWTEVTREDFFAVFGFRELQRANLRLWLVAELDTLEQVIPHVARRLRGRDTIEKDYVTFLQLVGAPCQEVLLAASSEAARVSGAPALYDAALLEAIRGAVARFKTSVIGLRAVWSASSYADSLLWGAEQQYLTCASLGDLVTSTLLLTSFALADPKHGEDAASILGRPPGPAGMWQAVHESLRAVIDRALHDEPRQHELVAEKARRTLSALVMPSRVAALGLDAPGRMPEHLVLPTLLRNSFSLTEEEGLRLAIQLLPRLVRARPEELYFPAEVLACFKRNLVHRDALSVLDTISPREAGAKPTVARRAPGPNEPCSCGSGRKYKKCCGRVA